MNKKKTINTNIGDLVNAFYEEALAQCGDPDLATLAAHRLINNHLESYRRSCHA